MKLEMNILKEKVHEDEKNSGIGSLYDDDKNALQHISLLKEKYAQLHQSHEKEIERFNRRKIEVMEE